MPIERPRRSDIECCPKCLFILRDEHRAKQVLLFDEWWWACADEDKCAERQEENKARHQKEIDGRLVRGRGRHTHLIVVQDRLGHQYGYGNYYVAVEHGQDVEQRAAKYRDDPELVIEQILEIEGTQS